MYLCRMEQEAHFFQRYFIKLAFDGTNYYGWQKQPNAKSIQETLEEKLSIIMKSPVSIVGAGRTDTGVHAREYFAHFDCVEIVQNLKKIIYKLNSLLPSDIAVYNLFAVNNKAHARYSATSRTYKYYISKTKDPFNNRYSLRYSKSLDLKSMQIAAEKLRRIGNFKCFSKSKEDIRNFECIVYEAYWEEYTNQYIFTIKANRFLRNMVRAIVGTMLEIGENKISISELDVILRSENRSLAGKSVDGKALFLEKIEYPEFILKID